MLRFKIFFASTLPELLELLNTEQADPDGGYFTITDLSPHDRGWRVIIDRMPVELITLTRFNEDTAYQSPDMA